MIATGLRQSTQAKRHVPMLITGRKAVMASDVGLESLVSVNVKDRQQCRFELAASDQDRKKNEVKEYPVRLPCVGRARYAENCVRTGPRQGSFRAIQSYKLACVDQCYSMFLTLIRMGIPIEWCTWCSAPHWCLAYRLAAPIIRAQKSLTVKQTETAQVTTGTQRSDGARASMVSLSASSHTTLSCR